MSDFMLENEYESVENGTLIVVGQGHSYYVTDNVTHHESDDREIDEFTEIFPLFEKMKKYCDNNGLKICENLTTESIIEFADSK